MILKMFFHPFGIYSDFTILCSNKWTPINLDVTTLKNLQKKNVEVNSVTYYGNEKRVVIIMNGALFKYFFLKLYFYLQLKVSLI